MRDPDEGGGFVEQFLSLDINLFALGGIDGDAALFMQRIVFRILPALPVPLADLFRGEPLRLEAGVEFSVEFDKRQFKILAGVIFAQRPIGSGFQRLDFYFDADFRNCLLYTSPSPRDGLLSRMPSSA